MKMLALEFLYPPHYPSCLVDQVQTALTPSLRQWGMETFKALKRHLAKHPSELTAIKLTAIATETSYLNQQIYAMAAMKLVCGSQQPDFVCYIGSLSEILSEKERILADVQSESAKVKGGRTMIAQIQPD